MSAVSTGPRSESLGIGPFLPAVTLRGKMHPAVVTCYYLRVLVEIKSWACKNSAWTSGGNRGGDRWSASGQPAQTAMPGGTHRMQESSQEGEITLLLRGLLRGYWRDLRQHIRGWIMGLSSIHLKSEIPEFEFLLLH